MKIWNPQLHEGKISARLVDKPDVELFVLFNTLVDLSGSVSFACALFHDICHLDGFRFTGKFANERIDLILVVHVSGENGINAKAHDSII